MRPPVGDLTTALAQEIRNCTIRLLNSHALTFIEDCSQNPDYREVIKKIGDEKIRKKEDQELVLRFFALKNDIEHYKFPVAEYLTNYLEGITTQEKPFDYIKEKEIFDKTFKIINLNLGDSAFSKYYKRPKKFVKYILQVSLFEAIRLVYSNYSLFQFCKIAILNQFLYHKPFLQSLRSFYLQLFYLLNLL